MFTRLREKLDEAEGVAKVTVLAVLKIQEGTSNFFSMFFWNIFNDVSHCLGHVNCIYSLVSWASLIILGAYRMVVGTVGGSLPLLAGPSD